jgi:hypothetical protein
MKTLITFIIGTGLIVSSFADSAATSAKPPPMYTHVYKLDYGTFVSHLRQLVPPRVGESNEELLLRFAKEQHIKLPKPSSIVLNEKQGWLKVTMPRAVRAKVDKLVQHVVEGK